MQAIARAVEESGRTCERRWGEGRMCGGRRVGIRCEGCRRAEEVERGDGGWRGREGRRVVRWVALLDDEMGGKKGYAFVRCS